MQCEPALNDAKRPEIIWYNIEKEIQNLGKKYCTSFRMYSSLKHFFFTMSLSGTQKGSIVH